MSHSAAKAGNRLSGFSINTRTFKAVFALLALLTLCCSAQAQNITLRSRISPLTGTSNLKYADLYGDGNIAVLGTYGGRGVYIFDITNPDAPVLASLYNPTPNLQMLEALVRNGIGYFGSGSSGGGVHIVDLSNPYSPVLKSKIDTTNGGFSFIHEILLYNNYLIENENTLGNGPRLRVFDISNPSAPVFVREFTTTDSTWVHATHIAGNRLFTSGWGGTTNVYDLTNIATQAPALIGTIVTGSNSHSSWTSTDGNYLYNARELVDGDLRVYNITNLAAPTLVKTIKAADLGLNAICPHNPVVMGNLLFVAWYQAGLQVFDISNPANPVRVGQYDTFSTAFNREDALARGANEPWDLLCATPDSLLRNSSVPSSYDGNWSVYPFLGLNKVLLGDLAGGLYIVDASRVLSAPRNRVADFDGDGKTDVSQFRASTGSWYWTQSSDSQNLAQPFGLGTDRMVPADYDGDGKTDIAVWRPTDGTWYMLQSTAGFRAQQFGTSGDIPVTGDYDADGKADVAVFRPSTGTWYVSQSTLGFTARQWGVSTDKPVVGDYDGDGKMDIGVYRPSNGTWYISQSSSSIALTRQFGASTDNPLIGDFDGDNKSDFAVFRPSEGVWYMLRSSTGAFAAQQFGLNGDIPVPADYDGDNKTDIAVWRPSAASWYLLKSATNAFEARQFGTSEDIPAPSAYNPQ
ncbi:MAG TPA: FG-GAP-like repeat-containing protein [Pyrinomonadaceae bacterium]